MESINFVSRLFKHRGYINVNELHGVMKMLKRSTSIAGAPGSGAGKGGGAGGAIKEGGGGLGMWGVAEEEGYFYDKQREQLKNLKKQMKKNEKDKPTIQKKQE